MSVAAELIDMRTVPALQRHPLIFGAFDALVDGESFEIVSDHDPGSLREAFGRTRAGQFHWHVVEGGPRRWRVRVERGGCGGERSARCCCNG